jgi:tetratricopeptide (TPR) repeat protein
MAPPMKPDYADGIAGSNEAPAQGRRHILASALTELRGGRLDAAEKLCNQLYESAPQDPAPHQLAATISLQRGRLEDAARWVRSCLALCPDHPPALILAGRITRKIGDLVQAAVYFKRASQLVPDLPEPAFLTCVTLLEKGDPEAHAVLARLQQRFPNDAEGWREIGDTLWRAGQLEAAAVALARAANVSDDPSHQSRLGAALQALGRANEAIIAFRTALASAPDLAAPRMALAMCLRLTGELQMARIEFERALAIEPGDSRAWFALGLVCEDLHDRPGAIRAYRRSVELQPDFPEAHVNLGLNLQHFGDLESAMASYRRAVRLRPDTFGRIAQALTSAKKGQLWLNLGRLRRSLGS